MRAWFAERGVQLPATPPPAAKAASDHDRILGDGTGNGTVGWWDLWHLWNHLAEGYEGFTLDLDALDINRSGAPDWLDLGLLGDYLYGSGANPHGIGQPIVPEPAFNIELVFANDFRYSHRAIVREAADRWEAIITGDIVDIDFRWRPFDSDDHDWWSDLQESYPFIGRVTINEVVDDLRIYVGYLHTDEFAGWARSFWVRTSGPDAWTPILGAAAIHRDVFDNSTQARNTALHEIAHVLGFNDWAWEKHDLLSGEASRRHFRGTNARRAFVAEKGWRWVGPRVPLALDAHWRESAFGDELMSTDVYRSDSRPLSRTTLQSFADLGYEVDPSQADAYEVPRASAKPAGGAPPGRCGVIAGAVPYGGTP